MTHCKAVDLLGTIGSLLQESLSESRSLEFDGKSPDLLLTLHTKLKELL